MIPRLLLAVLAVAGILLPAGLTTGGPAVAQEARAPLPLVFSLCRPCVNAQRLQRCVSKTHSLPPLADPLGN